MTDTWAPQEGKFGKTRDGQKVGPAIIYAYSDRVGMGGPHDKVHHKDGRYYGDDRGLDLISEWSEPAPVTPSPVREVTTKVIEPGVYGKVKVGDVGTSHVFVGLLSFDTVHVVFTADELDAAASVFTALAAALRDGAK